MTVFKTFLKILNKRKAPIIMYTVFLVIFSSFNMQANEKNVNFVAEKPDVVIIDESKGTISEHLVGYFDENAVLKSFESEDDLSDALFYRDVNCIIRLSDSFDKDVLSGKTPRVEVEMTGDYQSSLAKMMLERYLKVLDIYSSITDDEEELLRYVDETLATEVEVEVASELDTDSLSKAATYFNFTNYCILAGTIYIIALIMAIFKEKRVDKRTIVSSMDYRKFNRDLLLANGLFAVVLWAIYVAIGIVIIGDVLLSMHGLFFIANSFFFTICALTISFLLGNLLSNKEAINGIVNVIALGSSFLCGAFVPIEWLPEGVLKIAHVLPSYWFIANNEFIKTVEEFDKGALTTIFINMGVIVLFAIGFAIVTNMVTRKKRKVA